MEYVSTITTVLVFYTIAAVSPGPNFIVITRTALAESRENGLYTGIGVATGTSLWAIVGAFGLGFLLTYVPWLSGALKVIGGIYLIYLGYRFLRGAREPLAEVSGQGSGVEGNRGRRAAYMTGLLTNATNPKAAAFFASLYASVVTPETPLWVYVAFIVPIGVIAMLWYGSLGLIFSTGTFQTLYRRAKVVIDVVCGGLLVVVGGGMLIQML